MVKLNNETYKGFVIEFKELFDNNKNRAVEVRIKKNDKLVVGINLKTKSKGFDWAKNYIDKNKLKNKSKKEPSEFKYTITLKELNKMINDGEQIIVEYTEDSELDDKFIEMDIINPNYEQQSIDAYVPFEYAPDLYMERELAITNQYYNWTSDFMRNTLSKYNTKKEAIKDANKVKNDILRECKEIYGKPDNNYKVIVDGEWVEDEYDNNEYFIPQFSIEKTM